MAQSHNLAVLAEESFERHGDYESVWFEGEWRRSRELFERAQRVASALAELGVAPGDRVVVFGANNPEISVAYHAIWRAGAVVTPAIFLLPVQALAHLVADAEATAVLASPEFAATAQEAAANLPAVRFIASTDGLPEAEPRPPVDRSDSDLAALLYTGGTTGRSKGVMLSHENLWHAGRAGHEASHVAGVTRGLLALPLSHAYGLLVTAVALHSPERLQSILLRWFDAEAFVRLVSEHRVQSTAVVPSMIQALLALPLEDHDLSSLRYVVSGAAPLPREVAEELRRRVPTAEVREGYGLTETSGLVASNPPGRVRPGSVGVSVPGSELKIVDDEGVPLPAGEVGEICCRSRFVMSGYWRAPELTAETVQDGWLRTGDLGYVDEDGYLYVVDRKKDLIIRGGFNVYPRDVEDTLLEHPAVAAAAVVGRPDEAHGEEVVAFVELADRASVSTEELVAYAKERIGGYKYPREVRLVPSIPLTSVGKVDRKALRAQAAQPA